MKKLIAFAAVAACGAALAVESANIVGYSTISGVGASQYVALGTIFEDVSGGDIAVKNVVTVGDPISGTGIGAADNIWRWNTATSTWTKYFYYKKRGEDPRWVVSTDTTYTETSDTIPAGETFFFLRSGGATGTTTLTLAGGVKDLTGTSSFTASASQLAFASNPWPIALNIKNFASLYTSGEPVSGTGIGAADQIWLWNSASSTWTKYFYYKKRGEDPRWVVDGDTTYTETEDSIPAGVGFFFQRSGGASSAATVTFSN